MRKINTFFAQKLWLIVLGIVLSVVTRAASNETVPKECFDTGTVLIRDSIDKLSVYPGGDYTCRFLVILDNGKLLEPAKVDIKMEIENSMRVYVGHEKYGSEPSCSDLGVPSKIYCMRPVTPEDCYAEFASFKIKCDPSYPNEKCGENTYEFVSFSSPNVVSHKWTINDSVASKDSAFIYQFLYAGTYEVCLEIITADSCINTVCETIVIDPLTPECEAGFEFYDVDSNSYEHFVKFINHSSQNTTKWFWNFGDGTTSKEWSPTHEFPGPGEYNVCLTASSGNCQDSICMNVYVDSTGDCYAEFGYYKVDYFYSDSTQDTIASPFTYQFDNYSSPDTKYWKWNFGDGSYSNEHSPRHQFPAPGVYEVCLMAYSDNCQNSLCLNVYVDSNDGCYAEFGYYKVDYFYSDSTQDTIASPFTYQFDNYSSPDTKYWKWNFGDGSYSHEFSPRHQFPGPGVYEVCLTAYSSDFCEDVFCNEVYVDSNGGCYAKFGYYKVDYFYSDSTQDTIASPFTYQFDNYSSPDTKYWKWNFGDGSYSHEFSPRHQFPGPGVYEVCLTAYSSDFCEDVFCREVYVDSNGGCYAEFGYYKVDYFHSDSTPDTIASPFTYQFYNYSSPDTKYWKWNFGDGTYSHEFSPLHRFPGPGVYEVCLTASSDNCHDNICMNVYVDSTGGCYAEFDYYKVDYFHADSTQDTIASPFTYQFYNYSSPDTKYWKWNFGDGTYSHEFSPLHRFPGPGVYEVCLTAYSSDFCEDVFCSVVYVDSISNCYANFEYCSYSLTKEKKEAGDYTAWGDSIPENKALLIGFKNLSSPDHAYYVWNFGDGDSSFAKNPVHKYEKPGKYLVCLDLFTTTGCQETYCKEISVGLPECEVDFTVDIAVPNCEGFQVAHLFKPKADSDIYSINWSFGDGEASSEMEPFHIYPKYGSYTACLEVFYANGCKATQCSDIVISSDSVKQAFMKSCGTSPVHNPYYDGAFTLTKAFPLPASNALTLEVSSPKEQTLSIKLIDLFGRTYTLIQNYDLSNGLNVIETNIEKFKTGSYILSIETSTDVLREKISIIK